MIIENNVSIPTRDVSILLANVYRPEGIGKYPVVMTQGPYGKDAHFADAFAHAWDNLKQLCPGVDVEGSSGAYLRWEMPDPERWVPRGYVVVAVDSRGSGESPGVIEVYSSQQTDDYCDTIQWAGTQPWSTGKVGLIGISYYAINQWQVAARQPPHLAAIIPWEGSSDMYRDSAYHGGIYSSEFTKGWWGKQILSVQNGNADSTYFSRETGKRTTGDPLPADVLTANRVDFAKQKADHRFDDDFYAERVPKMDRVVVPLLSSGNWGGIGQHLRGNIEAFTNADSKQKWLEMHGGTHYETFYMPEFVDLQMRFFDHFLHGKQNGWDDEPPVRLQVRHPDRFVLRKENEWPLARTQWTRYALDAANFSLAANETPDPATVSYSGLGEGVTFRTAPMTQETEITGPLVAVLWVATSTTDMDLFITVQAWDPQGREVTFPGATDPAVPITQGWLRLSHRELDPERTLPWRPFYRHKRLLPVEPGRPYRVEVEVLPTSIVLPTGYVLGLRVEGKDFEREGATGPRKGSGPYLHRGEADRPAAIFNGLNTLHTGGSFDAHLLLPLVPASKD